MEVFEFGSENAGAKSFPRNVHAPFQGGVCISSQEDRYMENSGQDSARISVEETIYPYG